MFEVMLDAPVQAVDLANHRFKLSGEWKQASSVTKPWVPNGYTQKMFLTDLKTVVKRYRGCDRPTYSSYITFSPGTYEERDPLSVVVDFRSMAVDLEWFIFCCIHSGILTWPKADHFFWKIHPQICLKKEWFPNDNKT